jgi:hypothetical protein
MQELPKAAIFFASHKKAGRSPVARELAPARLRSSRKFSQCGFYEEPH